MTTPLPEPAIHAPFLKEVRTVWMGDYYTVEQLKDYGSAEYKRGLEDRSELIALLKEARKIIKASSNARSSHADWLNRTKDMK